MASKEASGTTKEHAQAPSARTPSSKQTRRVADGETTVAQRTPSQLGAKAKSRDVTETKALLTEEEPEDEVILVPVSRGQRIEARAASKSGYRTEEMVSQNREPSGPNT